jgi:hypothetical protein
MEQFIDKAVTIMLPRRFTHPDYRFLADGSFIDSNGDRWVVIDTFALTYNIYGRVVVKGDKNEH